MYSITILKNVLWGEQPDFMCPVMGCIEMCTALAMKQGFFFFFGHNYVIESPGAFPGPRKSGAGGTNSMTSQGSTSQSQKVGPSTAQRLGFCQQAMEESQEPSPPQANMTLPGSKEPAVPSGDWEIVD